MRGRFLIFLAAICSLGFLGCDKQELRVSRPNKNMGHVQVTSIDGIRIGTIDNCIFTTFSGDDTFHITYTRDMNDSLEHRLVLLVSSTCNIKGRLSITTWDIENNKRHYYLQDDNHTSPSLEKTKFEDGSDCGNAQIILSRFFRVPRKGSILNTTLSGSCANNDPVQMPEVYKCRVF
jgi:hypothetical protein